MITGIEGFLGDGKTIFMVRCAIKDFKKGRKIFSNLKLIGIDYEQLKITDFLNTENASKYINASLFIDEITLFMDCRRSARKENIALSTLLRQSRKRDLDIYYTCQNLDETDLRLIRYTSIFIIAQRCFIIKDNKYVELENWRNYTIIDNRRRKENLTRMNLNISSYYNYYDTNEIIESIYEEKQNGKKK
jgi:hypothetical protein